MQNRPDVPNAQHNVHSDHHQQDDDDAQRNATGFLLRHILHLERARLQPSISAVHRLRQIVQEVSVKIQFLIDILTGSQCNGTLAPKRGHTLHILGHAPHHFEL